MKTAAKWFLYLNGAVGLGLVGLIMFEACKGHLVLTGFVVWIALIVVSSVIACD